MDAAQRDNWEQYLWDLEYAKEMKIMLSELQIKWR